MVDLGGYVIILVETRDKKIKLYGSPADRADLEVGDEILEVNGKSLEEATHTEVIAHIHQCIKSRTICLRVKRKTGNKLALDLAQNSNVQDAFVIAVEQQARERLERLSALQKIKPVDMTKLSQQLSQEPTTVSEELNGLIENSPIYVTSVPELSGSTGDRKSSPAPVVESSRKSPTSASRPIVSNGYGRNVTCSPEQRPDEEIELKQELRDNHNNNSLQHGSGSKESLSSSDSSADEGDNVSEKNERNKAALLIPVGEVAVERRNGDANVTAVIANTAPTTMKSRGEELPMTNLQPNWNSRPPREMAVDVPDSFVGTAKTPPRYPPPNKSGSTSTKKRENGSVAKPVPLPRSNGTVVDGGGKQKQVIGVRVLPPHPDSGKHQRTSYRGEEPSSTEWGDIGDQATLKADQADRIRKYQDDIRRRREEEERIQREQEFLRTSLRGSKKLQALEQNPPLQPPAGFLNSGFEPEDSYYDQEPPYKPLQRIVGTSELISALQRVQGQLRTNGHQAPSTNVDLSAIGALLHSPDFQRALSLHNKVQDECCFHSLAAPLCSDAQELAQDVVSSLHECALPEAAELVDLLTRFDVEGLLFAHDRIASREPTVGMGPGEEILDRVANYTDASVRVVRIEKTNEPLGATVRNDGEAVVVGRIVAGGAAEKSGLLHEGDEILEVNGIEMRGKSVNDVCDILANMTGTLTFLIVPSSESLPKQAAREPVMHVKAHFDYDPEDDLYIPCRELGISFQKGDILHVLNRDDSNWWQAYREGEEDQTLAGLIPSKTFQQQREALKQTIVGDTSNNREKTKKGGVFLCAKKNTKKKKKKILYNVNYSDGKGGAEIDVVERQEWCCAEADTEEILTYEEVVLYYPRANRKRPVVLIGPPNIGRHELRQKLMEDIDRFAAAVPHTSRPRKDGEIDGQDYYFITRQQFEADILARKFVEHGEYEKNYYGTSLDAIRTVVNSGKICVLNLHPQSLKILKASDLKPFVVFVAPPSLEKLRQNRNKMGVNIKDDELKDVIEKAREMEDAYGHYFDYVIVNSDLDRAYSQLLHEINQLEREPQWVPQAWLKNDIS